MSIDSEDWMLWYKQPATVWEEALPIGRLSGHSEALGWFVIYGTVIYSI